MSSASTGLKITGTHAATSLAAHGLPGYAFMPGLRLASYENGAEGRNRTDNLSERVLSAPRLPVSPQPQNWSATKDLHLHTTRAFALEANASAVPPVADGESIETCTLITAFGGLGLIYSTIDSKTGGHARMCAEV